MLLFSFLKIYFTTVGEKSCSLHGFFSCQG
nr:MAG TPA: hypothetical protein [Caudoviricetes sp.]DAE81551.1 MAG TPA: hypothetical protein [Caudoviricetes sp.]